MKEALKRVAYQGIHKLFPTLETTDPLYQELEKYILESFETSYAVVLYFNTPEFMKIIEKYGKSIGNQEVILGYYYVSYREHYRLSDQVKIYDISDQYPRVTGGSIYSTKLIRVKN